jgi:hypothetical protein
MRPIRSIRLIPQTEDYLDRTVGESGELFFDKDTQTLRLYDGSSNGFELARVDLTNVSDQLFLDRLGNAGLVLTTNSYANPSWITSLAGSKITGAIPNVVYTTDTGTVTNTMLANNFIRLGNVNATLGSTPRTTLTGFSSISSTQFVGAFSGNATTATRLQTARTINGVAFDGTQNIVIGGEGEVVIPDINANALIGTTLASTVVNSSLTSVGTLASLTVTGTVTLNGATTVNNTLAATSVSSTTTVAATTNVTAGAAISAGTTVSAGTNVTATNNVTAGNNITATNNITAGGTVTTQTYFVQSATPVEINHVTNKKYVDARSVAMAVALS